MQGDLNYYLFVIFQDGDVNKISWIKKLWMMCLKILKIIYKTFIIIRSWNEIFGRNQSYCSILKLERIDNNELNNYMWPSSFLSMPNINLSPPNFLPLPDDSPKIGEHFKRKLIATF